MAGYPYYNNFAGYNPYPMNNFQSGNSSPQTLQGGYFQNGNSQTNGFVRVQSEDEARRYPVTVGSITFIDDNAPFCYVKTAPISPMDAPTFKRYRLVEENESPQNNAQNGDTSAGAANSIDLSNYVEKSAFDALRAQFDDIVQTIDKLRFDVDSLGEKSSKKMVQKARKDADEE